MGDRKPTELLRRLHELSDTVAENAPIIKKLSFSRLPSEVQTILAPNFGGKFSGALASMADSILEFSARPNHIPLPAPTVAATDNKGISSSLMAELLTKIDTWSNRLENLELER